MPQKLVQRKILVLLLCTNNLANNCFFPAATLSLAWGANATILGVKGAKLGPAEKNCLKVGVKAQKIGRTMHANREIEQLTSHKHNMNETEIYGGML